jgi:mxaJ protein
MCSRCPDACRHGAAVPARARSTLAAFLAWLLAGCSGPPAADPPRRERELRVCADPNNLPFTNDRLEGFENRIAALLAREMQAGVRYTR